LAGDRDFIDEILLVDDGSDDGTADVATATAAELNLSLSVLNASFQNAGASRNVGIVAAKAEFLYFLDADDEAASGGLRALVECLRANANAGVAVGGYVRRALGRSEKKRYPRGYGRDRIANARRYLLNKSPSIAMGSALLRREVIDDIRFPEALRFDEDTFFWAAVLCRADVATVKSAVMIYNVVDERHLARLTTAPRGEWLKAAHELRNLRSYGVDERVLKWRLAWLARRIARALLTLDDPVSAGGFLRPAMAHPTLRWSPSTLRYAVRTRSRLSRLSRERRRNFRAVAHKASRR
jgi:glycosyltransferase involved in cell wall biosynthesis